MNKISNLDADMKAMGVNPRGLDFDKNDPYLEYLGLGYIGRQERLNNFPLDAFNDLVTGSTHLRKPMESIFDMLRRIKKAHTR